MRISRSCPVCDADVESASLFLEENIDEARISGFSFASRKEPEYMCHRLMRCNVCDLVYVSEPPEQSELAEAYHQADYDSSEEADDAATSYIKAMQPIFRKLANKEDALEIGAGTGILLEMLKQQGFHNLVGVEPSVAAISAAPEHRKPWLHEGIFREEEFEPESFDLICCFMTMEHVQDPAQTAQAAYRLLRPGGAFVTITHDYTSLVNRILGARSPIIDIEHMQIFSARSITELFKRSGYRDIDARPFYNRYSIRYWTRLAPLPSSVKSAVAGILVKSGLGKIHLSANVGNTICVGYK